MSSSANSQDAIQTIVSLLSSLSPEDLSKLKAALDDTHASKRKAEERASDWDNEPVYSRPMPQQERPINPTIPLHRLALKVVPDLLPWQESLTQHISACYLTFYFNRRNGTYPFAVYKIGQALYCLASEISAWVKAGQPPHCVGWAYPCPIPAHLFKYADDAQRLGVTTNA